MTRMKFMIVMTSKPAFAVSDVVVDMTTGWHREVEVTTDVFEEQYDDEWMTTRIEVKSHQHTLLSKFTETLLIEPLNDCYKVVRTPTNEKGNRNEDCDKLRKTFRSFKTFSH